MTQIEKLTPEQEALMATVRNDWLDFIFRNDDQPIDEAAAKSGVAFLYGLANLKPPRVIVKDSPMACQRGVYDQGHGQVYGQGGFTYPSLAAADADDARRCRPGDRWLHE